MLEKYGHGGDLRSASELFGKNVDELLDYSSNMNPLGPPKSFKKAIEDYWQHIVHYPDPVQRELVAAIADKHKLKQESIVVGNGAAELIDLIVRQLQPAKAALLIPSFVEYEQAIVKAGCEPIYIETSEQLGFIPTLEQLQQVHASKRPDLYMLGYPNNPTGTLIPMEHILYLLDEGATVVIDEAFIDFHLEEEQITMMQWLERYDRLFVIRSMTKFYSIPGIRLGYMAGDEQTIRALKQLQVPWSVNSLAQRLGCIAFSESEFADQTKAWLAEEIPWMKDAIEQLHLKPYATVTNYMLVGIGEHYAINSKQLQQLMGARGILIRDAATFRGLSDRYIRLAIKSRESNHMMLRALADVLKDYRKDERNVTKS